MERDPTYFHFIVRFLLEGSLPTPPSRREQSAIEREFTYFKIPLQFQVLSEFISRTGPVYVFCF